VNLSRGRPTSGARRGRDRDRLVGLAGWLFADMLLGLSVVFLVVESKRGDDPTPQNGESPTVQISEIEGKELNRFGGVPTWSRNEIVVNLQVKFSERVESFEHPYSGQPDGDIAFSDRTPKDWYVESMEPTDDGQTWNVSLSVPDVRETAYVDVFIPEGAATATKGSAPNEESNVFTFHVTPRDEERIDSARGVFVTMNMSLVCESTTSRTSASPATERSAAQLDEYLRNLDNRDGLPQFLVGPPEEGKAKRQAPPRLMDPDDPSLGRIDEPSAFLDWIQKSFTTRARIGWLLIYGSKSGGAEQARRIQPCVMRSLELLGFLGEGEDLAWKALKAENLQRPNEFRLEMYFYTATDD
jgi:hypothetical protein